MQLERRGAGGGNIATLPPVETLVSRRPDIKFPIPAIPTAGSSRGRWDILWLTILFGILFAFRIGAGPLTNPDEGRYAEIPREMALTGDWVTPRLDGVKYFEKPPLVYWLVAASREVFGPSEKSVRLVLSAFALGGVLLTYAGVRRLHGRDAGLISSIVLGTSLFFFVMGRVLTLDMTLAGLMSATMFCFILGVNEVPGTRRRLFFYGLYASAALAVLTKGLIGALIPGAVFVLWLSVARQWRRLRPLYLPSGVLLFAAIAAPWHIMVARANPDWAWFYFVHEHFQRFTSTIHGRSQPWWFFLPILFLGLFPWSGFVWPSLKMVWRDRRENTPGAANLQYYAIWTGFILLFFSVSDSKLAPYILPAFPAVAALIGVWIARTVGDREDFKWRAALRVFSIISGVLAIAIVVIVAKPSLLRAGVTDAAAARPFVIALAVVMTIAAVQGWRASLTNKPREAIGTLVVTAALTFGLLTFAAPPLLRPGTKELAAIAKREFQPGDQIFSYHDFFHDFPYYSGLMTGIVDGGGELEFGIAESRDTQRFIDDAEFGRRWNGPDRVFVVLSKRDAPRFFDAGFQRVHTLGESAGHYLLSNR